jgi:hypothetical protein
MSVFRILGLVGSASCLAILCIALVHDRIPNKPIDWWVIISLTLVGFNFVPLSNWRDSLIGLWIEAKKSKLRKEINDD